MRKPRSHEKEGLQHMECSTERLSQEERLGCVFKEQQGDWRSGASKVCGKAGGSGDRSQVPMKALAGRCTSVWWRARGWMMEEKDDVTLP